MTQTAPTFAPISTVRAFDLKSPECESSGSQTLIPNFYTDAVWAGALAVADSRDQNGAVDKTNLVEVIRGRAFQASSGTVSFDPETGDR